MTRLVRKAELARWAQVSRAAAGKAAKGPLADAVQRDAEGVELVDAEHPLVREWLAGHGVTSLPPPPEPKPAKRRAKARKPAQGKTPVPKTPAQPAAPAPQVVPPETAPAAVPDYLTDLQDLTIRQVVTRYGSADGFKRYVDALRGIMEFQQRELRVQQLRGELIERDMVAGAVFALIDVSFARLVNDVPDAIAKGVIARVESGGPDTMADVVALIRDANSRVLRNLKESASQLEVLKRAN